MKDEEAIKYLKNIKDKDLWKLGYVYGKEAIETVLNLIIKQQAEIEGLNFDKDVLNDIVNIQIAEIEKQKKLLKLSGTTELKLSRKIVDLKTKIEKYKYLYQKALDNTIKSDKELQVLKRDFEIVDHECSRLEQEDIRKDMIIGEMSKFINFKIDGKNTPKQWKEYFENKVKESK